MEWGRGDQSKCMLLLVDSVTHGITPAAGSASVQARAPPKSLEAWDGVYLNQGDVWSLEGQVPVARGGAPQKQDEEKGK